MSGYRIDHETLVGNKVWTVSLGESEKLIDVRTQYTTQSLATVPSYILPTAFGVEGVLLYKYLDSNMFAITTQNLEDPFTYNVMFVNGVTGAVIHQQ